MTHPIIDFIEARLAEDEASAAAADGPWIAYAMRYFNEVSEEFGSIRAAFYWLADNDYCEKHVPDRIIGPGGVVIVDSETMTQLDKGGLDDKQNAFETWLRRRHHPLLGADPARVLREVQAKRRVLARYEEAKHEARNPVSAANRQAARVAEGELEDVLRDLAAVYSDHPDFDPDWSTT